MVLCDERRSCRTVRRDNDARVYLLYSVAGESGIAIAELKQGP